MKILFSALIVLNYSLAFCQQMTVKEALLYTLSTNGYLNPEGDQARNHSGYLAYYCQVVDEANYKKSMNDEFKKNEYLQTKDNELTKNIKSLDYNKIYSFSSVAIFGEYDFTGGCFHINLGDFKYKLYHTNLAYSDFGHISYDVGMIDNLSDFDFVLKMDKSTAEKFINSRKDNMGKVNRTINVKITYNVVKRGLTREESTIYLALNAQKILFFNGSVVLKEFFPKVSKTITFTKDTNKTVTDIDGNVYHKILIGNQVWLSENLKTTRYRNGDLIGTTTQATLDIRSEVTPKYQWAYDGDERNVATYGRLYTWYVAQDSRNLCPKGWHVPTFTELETLKSFLGNNAGDELKEIGMSHWKRDNERANNRSGFSALPGGYRLPKGVFDRIGFYGYWWSSVPYGKLSLEYNFSTASLSGEEPAYGFSIRCIQD